MRPDEMDRRKFPRFEIRLPVSFSGPGGAGEGVVVNLSREGCCIESDARPSAGTYLDLRLQLPDDASPLGIDSAAVRWLTEEEFGVQFLYMKQVVHARLDAFVDALEARAAGQHQSSGQRG